MPRIFYITTPIFYPNDRLHLGHAYTIVMADIIARYKKSQGYQIFFQTGSDEHGEKIEKKANSLGTSPQELVDKNVLLFKQLWKGLGITEHNFYRTSSLEHREKVQKIFTELLRKGNIYLGKYQGKYCVTCEDYVSKGKVINSSFCPTPNCQTELKIVDEPAYFLKVSKYCSELMKYYSQNPSFLSPSSAKGEVFENFLKNDIRDLCITRSDIKWGIPVPNNEKMVIYVWFEALLNYLNSDEGEKAFIDSKWEIIHLIGKEITRFHAIYWLIILFSLNKRLPNKILAHGWLTTPWGKMSKSKGNVIDPLELLKKYPPDLLRIYFIAKINFLQDGVCDENLLKDFYQDFLVNNLSNLVSRTNKMLFLYNEGIVPEFISEKKDSRLEDYYEKCILSVRDFQKMMDRYELTKAFSQIQFLLDESNKLIQELAPWELAKKGEKLFLNLTLNCLVNGIKILSFLLNCIIPETSREILTTFNIDYERNNWDNLLDFNLLSKIKTNLLKKHLYSRL